jgi:hypothetical protein
MLQYIFVRCCSICFFGVALHIFTMLQYIISNVAIHNFRCCSIYFFDVAVYIFRCCTTYFTMVQYLYSDVALYSFFICFATLYLKCFVLCWDRRAVRERGALGRGAVSGFCFILFHSIPFCRGQAVCDPILPRGSRRSERESDVRR